MGSLTAAMSQPKEGIPRPGALLTKDAKLDTALVDYIIDTIGAQSISDFANLCPTRKTSTQRFSKSFLKATSS